MASDTTDERKTNSWRLVRKRVVLFAVQTWLVAGSNVALHRRLGTAGAALAGIIVPLGVVVAIQGARRGHNPGAFQDAGAFLIVGPTDILLFACFVAAGLLYRKQRGVHSRCMLLATIGGMLGPTVVRLPYVAGRFPAILGVLTRSFRRRSSMS